MIWVACHAVVASILVGGAGLGEVSATMEHTLGFPLTDELQDGMENEEGSDAVTCVAWMVFFSCTLNDQACHCPHLPSGSTDVFELPAQQGHHLVLHLQHFLLQK